MRIVFLLILSFLCYTKCGAQAKLHLNVRNITTKEGLTDNDCGNIVQDKNGIIWVSALSGLNKLDGLHIKKIVANRNDSTSIPNQPITNLKVDKDNNIWLSSNGYSVSKIDAKTEKVSYLKQNLDFAHFNQ